MKALSQKIQGARLNDVWTEDHTIDVGYTDVATKRGVHCFHIRNRSKVNVKRSYSNLTFVYIISLIIIIVVILLSVLTVNKGYRYKHTIDPTPKLDKEDNSPSKYNSKD